jgi:transcription antitermination protein NusB
MGSRRKARELALQLLFQEDVNRYPAEEIRRTFWKSNPVDQDTRDFADMLFSKAVEDQEKIDELIRRHSLHWRPDRMAKVDRNVLRMAVSEFLNADTPGVVVIDEAIEIVRKFSGAEATEFVNGILDAIRVELEQKAVQGE